MEIFSSLFANKNFNICKKKTNILLFSKTVTQIFSNFQIKFNYNHFLKTFLNSEFNIHYNTMYCLLGIKNISNLKECRFSFHEISLKLLLI